MATATEDLNSKTFHETPWGSWQVLDDSEICKVKKITVKPGKRLSYQKHFKREEHWLVVAGTAEVTLDDVIHTLQPGEQIFIPKEAAHRIANPTEDTDMIFIEVQRGTYFGEDDIVRLSDDYGRA